MTPSLILATALLAVPPPSLEARTQVLERVLGFGAHGGAVRDVELLDCGLEVEADLQGARRGGDDPGPAGRSRVGECLRSTAGKLFERALKNVHRTVWIIEETPPTAEARIPADGANLVIRFDLRPEGSVGPVTGWRLPDGKSVDDLLVACESRRVPDDRERELTGFVEGVASELVEAVARGAVNRLVSRASRYGVLCPRGRFGFEQELIVADGDATSAVSQRLEALKAAGRGALTDWEVESNVSVLHLTLTFGSEEVPVTIWRRTGGWELIEGLLCPDAVRR